MSRNSCLLTGFVIILLVLASFLTQNVKGASLREFQDTEELAQWLQTLPDRVPFFIDPAKGFALGSRYDCDDVATGIQILAYNAGFLVSVQIVENGKILGRRVTDLPGAHLGNLTIIGNDIYYFEKYDFQGGYRMTQVAVRD